MSTVTVWLLISIGFSSYQKAAPTQLVERFATQDDCVAVRDALNLRWSGMTSSSIHECLKARVAKP